MLPRRPRNGITAEAASFQPRFMVLEATKLRVHRIAMPAARSHRRPCARAATRGKVPALSRNAASDGFRTVAPLIWVGR